MQYSSKIHQNIAKEKLFHNKLTFIQKIIYKYLKSRFFTKNLR